MSSLPSFAARTLGAVEGAAGTGSCAAGGGAADALPFVGGGGAWLATLGVPLGGCCEGEAFAAGPGWLGCVADRFGSEPRPGGGGGLDGCAASCGGEDGVAARIEPDGGSGGGAETRAAGIGGDDGVAEAIAEGITDEDCDDCADAEGVVGGAGGGGAANGGAATGKLPALGG
jgi:hypothetical protein